MQTMELVAVMGSAVAQVELPDPKQAAEAIRHALGNGLREAARVYRQFIEAGGNVTELRRLAQLSGEYWRAIEGIANGDDPLLYVVSAPVRQQLRLVPHATLAQLGRDGVPVMDYNGNVRRVPLAELGPNQAALALDGPHVRTPEEQSKILAERKARETANTRPVQPYEVYTDRVTFNTVRGSFTVPWSMIVEVWKKHEKKG